jgi:hypothetical protein
MFNESETGLAAEEEIKNPTAFLTKTIIKLMSIFSRKVPSRVLTDLSHNKEPTHFQTEQDSIRKLFEDTAMLYAKIYPENKECQDLYNTMLVALYRPGSTGFLKDKQEFVAEKVSDPPGSPH